MKITRKQSSKITIQIGKKVIDTDHRERQEAIEQAANMIEDGQTAIIDVHEIIEVHNA